MTILLHNDNIAPLKTRYGRSAILSVLNPLVRAYGQSGRDGATLTLKQSGRRRPVCGMGLGKPGIYFLNKPHSIDGGMSEHAP